MKIIVTLSLLAFLFTGVNAQPGEHHCKKREQIKAQKVAFLTEQLNLTVEEAQKFWPLYNDYTAKVEELEKERRKLVNQYDNDKGTLSDKEVAEIYVKLIEIDTKLFKTENEFRKDIKDILSIRKMMELQLAERKFKHELLNKIKHCGPGMPPE